MKSNSPNLGSYLGATLFSQSILISMIMNKLSNYFTLVFLILSTIVTSQNNNESIYNYNDAFGHGFYTKNGTETRSASGKPGHAYWQNSADYSIKVSLDDKNKGISGNETITYTNNSPDDLEFLWLQVDQNLFREDSRGNAIIPLNGSRNGAKGQNFDGGYYIGNVNIFYDEGKKSKNKKVRNKITVRYEIYDTRMKILLPKPLKSRGGKLLIDIDFSFTSPDYGSDRMGVLETENGRIFNLAQWYPRMCVFMMIFQAGIHCLI